MRDTYLDRQIPTPIQQIPQPDHSRVSRVIAKHAAERYLGTVLGAGGVGGSLLLVPFQPAILRIINAAGATPRVSESYFPAGGTARHISTILAVAVNATPPVLTQVAAGNWTIALPTALAPDGETVIVEVIGFRDVGGSL